MPLLENGSLNENSLRERQEKKNRSQEELKSKLSETVSNAPSGRLAGSSLKGKEGSFEGPSPLEVLSVVADPIESVTTAPMRTAIKKAQEGKFSEALPAAAKQFGRPLKEAPTAGEIAMAAGVPEEYADPVGMGVEMVADPLGAVGKIGKASKAIGLLAAGGLLRKGAKAGDNVLDMADFAELRKARDLKKAEQAKIDKIYGKAPKTESTVTDISEGPAIKEAGAAKRKAEKIKEKEKADWLSTENLIESDVQDLKSRISFTGPSRDEVLDVKNLGDRVQIKVKNLATLKNKDLYVGHKGYIKDLPIEVTDGKNTLATKINKDDTISLGSKSSAIPAEEKFLSRALQRELEGPKKLGKPGEVLEMRRTMKSKPNQLFQPSESILNEAGDADDILASVMAKSEEAARLGGIDNTSAGDRGVFMSRLAKKLNAPEDELNTTMEFADEIGVEIAIAKGPNAKSAQGIHLDTPTADDLAEALSQADRDGFQRIFIHGEPRGQLIDASTRFKPKPGSLDPGKTGRVIPMDKASQDVLIKRAERNLNSFAEKTAHGKEMSKYFEKIGRVFPEDADEVISKMKEMDPSLPAQVLKFSGGVGNMVPNPNYNPGKNFGSIDHALDSDFFKDPFSWVQQSAGVTKAALKKAKGPINITTGSDLVGHGDFVELIPKGSTVELVLTGGEYGDEIYRLFPGKPSDQRLLSAAEKIKKERPDIDVKIIKAPESKIKERQMSKKGKDDAS